MILVYYTYLYYCDIFRLIRRVVLLMARVNIWNVKIRCLKKLVEEHFLFASENVPNGCKLAEIPYLDINGSDKSKQWSISVDSRDFPTIKFEEMYSGKGVIKSLWYKTFVITYKNDVCSIPEKASLICLLNLDKKSGYKVVLNIDGYCLSLFLKYLISSQTYVGLVATHLSRKFSVLRNLQSKGVQISLSKLEINLQEPDKHVMDLIWAKMACTMIHELRQLQYAMSWLSTLGGAFSALGDEQERCAKAAGMISVEQLRIALKLGDAIIASQCKLYFSLSLIQRGYCRMARKIIQEQYSTIKNSPVVDKKTVNMCKGIWARLKYETNKRRKMKNNIRKV